MAQSKQYWRKHYATLHEHFIARARKGVRSDSSGGAVSDPGDVRSEAFLTECKYQGSPGEELKRKPTMLVRMEKIAGEAYEKGRKPEVALRYYWPESPLANHEGWVDLFVRLVGDEDGN